MMSGSGSRVEKEKNKLIQEKCQSILNDLLKQEDNKYCVDCDAKGPRWASWNLGIFLCIRCAGIHRNLGVHISKVKSVNLDSWTSRDQVVSMQSIGNSLGRQIYEAFLPDNFRRPQTDSALEAFIRAKYEQKKYADKDLLIKVEKDVKKNVGEWREEVIIEEMMMKKKKNLGASTGGTSLFPKLKIPQGPGGEVIQNTRRQQQQNADQVKKDKEIKAPPPITAASSVPPAASSNLVDLVDVLGGGGGGSSGGVGNDNVNITTTNTTSASSNNLGGGGGVSELMQELSLDASSGIQGSKMTKESILSLYGSQGQGQVQGGGGGGGLGGIQGFPVQQQQQNNPAMMMNNPFSNMMQGMVTPGGLGLGPTTGTGSLIPPQQQQPQFIINPQQNIPQNQQSNANANLFNFF